jgi:hypothetical protein
MYWDKNVVHVTYVDLAKADTHDSWSIHKNKIVDNHSCPSTDIVEVVSPLRQFGIVRAEQVTAFWANTQWRVIRRGYQSSRSKSW